MLITPTSYRQAAMRPVSNGQLAEGWSQLLAPHYASGDRQTRVSAPLGDEQYGTYNCVGFRRFCEKHVVQFAWTWSGECLESEADQKHGILAPIISYPRLPLGIEGAG